MKKLHLYLLTCTLFLIAYMFLFPKFILPNIYAVDWPMFRMDPSHTGYNSEENTLNPPLLLKWTYQGFLNPGTAASPSVSDGIVYIRLYGYLYALDVQTGTPIWWRQTASSTSYDHAAPAIANGLVYVSNHGCDSDTYCGVVAYDAKTGEEKWHITLPRGARGVNVKDGVIYFGSDDWYVRAANAYTGELFWTSPQLNDGVTAVPVVANGRVYVGTWTGRVYALNSSDGRTMWQSIIGGVMFSSPTLINNTLYTGSGMASVFALDIADGKVKWEFNGAHDSVWGSPAVFNNMLYIQDLAGYIYALDISNGSLIWSYKTGAIPSSSYSSPAVANGVVYVGSQDGYIYALNPYTGAELWKYQTGKPIFSSPAVADGKLFVGSDDARIYVFDNVGPLPSPSPTPSPTSTPAPTPTPFPTLGPFELPFDYPGRLGISPSDYSSAFWGRLTAAFDHVLKHGVFRPFTGLTYSPSSCPARTLGITCYDSHNGTDFSRVGGDNVLSTANGNVVYTSSHSGSSCTPERGGFGCVVIAQYPGNIYGLYAHLSQIFVDTSNSISTSTVLGKMGNTGCPSCGVHLHFGVLKPISIFSLQTSLKMTRRDWQELLFQIKPDPSPRYKPSCTYLAPNGIQFSFQDPSGWQGIDVDPWSGPRSDGGCGIASPYLWKYPL